MFFGKRVPAGGAAKWTPTVTQSGAVTSFTINDCYYLQVGKLVFIWGEVSVNNAGAAAGANAITVTLPITAAFRSSRKYQIGTGWVYDSSANLLYHGIAELLTATTLDLLSVETTTDGTSTSIGAAGMVAALANGDIVNFFGVYEAL